MLLAGSENAEVSDVTLLGKMGLSGLTKRVDDWFVMMRGTVLEM